MCMLIWFDKYSVTDSQCIRGQNSNYFQIEPTEQVKAIITRTANGYFTVDTPKATNASVVLPRHCA